MQKLLKAYIDVNALCQPQGLVHAYCTDINHIAIHANQTQVDFTYEMLGITDVIGCSIWDLMSSEPKMAEVFCMQNEQVMRQGTLKQFYDVLEFKDRYRLEFLTTKIPFYDSDGKIKGVFGISNYINKFSTAKAMAMGLSQREAECLFYLLEMRQNEEIAKLMRVKKRTVESYIERAKIKFGCKSKAGLILKALNTKIKDSIKQELMPA